jgi:hypothetical protein
MIVQKIKNRIEEIKKNQITVKGSEYRIQELNNLYKEGLGELEKGFENRDVCQYKELISTMNKANEEAIEQLEAIKDDISKSKAELELFYEKEKKCFYKEDKNYCSLAVLGKNGKV